MYHMSAIYTMLCVYVPTRQRNSSQINRKLKKKKKWTKNRNRKLKNEIEIQCNKKSQSHWKLFNISLVFFLFSFWKFPSWIKHEKYLNNVLSSYWVGVSKECFRYRQKFLNYSYKNYFSYLFLAYSLAIIANLSDINFTRTSLWSSLL